MISLKEFRTQLCTAKELPLVFELPSGDILPHHFHVTEVGKVVKDFVDCGGTRRNSTVCMLQTLVADDVDHRLLSGKLEMIFEKSSVLGLDELVPIDVEVQLESISIFSLASVQKEEKCLRLTLARKSTACLAPDRCGIGLPVFGAGECGEPGCC